MSQQDKPLNSLAGLRCKSAIVAHWLMKPPRNREKVRLDRGTGKDADGARDAAADGQHRGERACRTQQVHGADHPSCDGTLRR
mgnify:FL=1